MSEHEARLRTAAEAIVAIDDLRALLADLDAARAALVSVKGLWLESCVSANAAGRADAQADLARVTEGLRLQNEANDMIGAERNALAASLARVTAERNRAQIVCKAVHGALLDAATVRVRGWDDVATMADGVRQITSERNALAARLARAEGLLRESLRWMPGVDLPDRVDAYFAEQEPRT